LSNDDFRRKLNDAFDDIAGSPSSALHDRVRSSISQAPEERGPYWIAAVAAAVLAVAIVGVLFIYNPLNHHPVPVGPGPGPQPSASPSASPAPSQSPSASPSASPTATPTTAFVCTTSAPITNTKAPLVAFIDAIRTGAHTGYDRLTVEFNNGQPSSIQLQPQADTVFTNSPSGQPVTLAGQNGILVTIHGADAHTDYSGPRDIKTGDRGLVEVRVVQDFEGTVQLALGIAGRACYHVQILPNPARLVIDIQTT
jgi:hypothetical protein